ncbi:SDR family NAD(P)-dependent oxidoreductase [Aestuariispira ectoiniformans]|uniref:SDR family NAD(P)-dependent oxidoreductase n=1 Tax=Aestuariispira ectoiniformans TaxID=2775080 RepID=UPI00223AF44C|nr:SDR family NAD(P)-dependent oxidoreductase [Aestuariispira ectoiniformans]
MQNRKIFITGADGFIGSHVTEAAVKAGAQVTALAAYNSFGTNGWLDDLEDDIRREVKIVRGDIRDSGFILREAQGQDIILHLAALIAIPYSYAAPQSYVDVNIQGTLNILEAARHWGIARVVHTSTSEVYGTAQFSPITEDHPLQGQSPYSASKIGADMMAESFARSFDLPVAILRPFNTYGPRQSERAVIPTIIRQALDPDCAEIRIGDLTPKRDFTFVTDTAGAFLALAGAEGIDFGRPYNAGTGHTVNIGDVLDEIRKQCGGDKPVVTDSRRQRPSKSEVRLLQADHSRLTTATGWRPETSLAKGLEQTIAWWQKQITQGKLRRDTDYAT